MKFLNIRTPLGMDVNLGTEGEAHERPLMVETSKRNQIAAMYYCKKFKAQGPPQWIMGKLAEATHYWLNAEGFYDIEGDYTPLNLESVIGQYPDIRPLEL